MSVDRYDYTKTRALQIEALVRAKAVGFPRTGALDVIVEGRDEWLTAVHERPALARLLLRSLDERDRLQSDASASVRLTIRDPALGEYLRP